MEETHPLELAAKHYRKGHRVRHTLHLHSLFQAGCTSYNGPPSHRQLSNKEAWEKTSLSHSDGSTQYRRAIHVVDCHDRTALILVHDKAETSRLAGHLISG